MDRMNCSAGLELCHDAPPPASIPASPGSQGLFRAIGLSSRPAPGVGVTQDRRRALRPRSRPCGAGSTCEMTLSPLARRMPRTPTELAAGEDPDVGHREADALAPGRSPEARRRPRCRCLHARPARSSSSSSFMAILPLAMHPDEVGQPVAPHGAASRWRTSRPSRAQVRSHPRASACIGRDRLALAQRQQVDQRLAARPRLAQRQLGRS